MSLGAVLLFAVGWQVSLATRPVKLMAHEWGRDAKDAPPGWADVMVPLAPDDTLGEPGQSHSQIGQDKLVQTILNCMRGGFYVDLAANDAVDLSNTLMLERDFGWTGICLEANPEYMLRLAGRRKCQVVMAAVGTPSNQEVTFLFNHTVGGIVGDGFDNIADNSNSGQTVTMKTKAIAEILTELKAPQVIDYLSLDVEGAESFVMQGFPWDSHHLRVLTVERPKQDLTDLLASKGYRFLRLLGTAMDQVWVDADLFEAIETAGWLQDWEVPSGEEFRRACPLGSQAQA